MTNKRLLVIGAGLAQYSSIVQAKLLGYEVFTTDVNPQAQGFAVADGYKVIDVKDSQQHIQWAKELRIDGVVSYASEICLDTVLAVRSAFGLPGLSAEAVKKSRDKALARVTLADKGMPQPRFEVVRTIEECIAAVGRIGIPAVLKPVDSSAARGVSVIRDLSALSLAWQKVVVSSHKKYYLLESFEEGSEITVDGFSYHGRYYSLVIADEINDQNRPNLCIELIYPAVISENIRQNIEMIAAKACLAMDVDNGPTHIEMVLTKEGPKIIEVGCRGGGFFIFGDILTHASGYDVVANWTRYCMGDPIDDVVLFLRGAVMRFLIANSGRLERIEGISIANQLEGVRAGCFYKLGDIVPEFIDGTTRTGWVVSLGADRADAIMKVNRAIKEISFITTEC